MERESEASAARILRAAVIIAALACAAAARADTTVDVQLTPEGEQLAQQLGVTPAQLAAQVKAEIDDAYQTSNIDSFLSDFVDATSFSARGIGVDYASLPKGFVAGFAVNLAAAGDQPVEAEGVRAAQCLSGAGGKRGVRAQARAVVLTDR